MPKNPTSYKLSAPLANVDKANRLVVSVYFSAGGINYFNYQNEPKGYYASVNPVLYTPASEPGGFASEQFLPFSGQGFKVFLKPATRFSSPALKTLAKTVLAKAGAIAEAYGTGGKNAAGQVVEDIGRNEMKVTA